MLSAVAHLATFLLVARRKQCHLDRILRGAGDVTIFILEAVKNVRELNYPLK